MKIDISIDEENRHIDGLADVRIEVPDLGLSRSLDVSFADLYNHCRVPDELVLDLLIVASLCYVVDKTVPRNTSFDFWTREFELEFPVADPKVWRNVTGNLTAALNFLTGDHWRLSFCKRETEIFRAPSRKRKRTPLPSKLENINAVCSLSGGVDSLTGAINLLESKEFRSIHLIGHYDAPSAKKAQRTLLSGIKESYPDRAELTQVRISHKPSKTNEPTLRSRSLVFMAIAIFAARAVAEDTPVFMPENGFIAMNIPLTPGRAGSCSTRTMHPFYLGKLRDTLVGLGIHNPIINPLELKTKGECIVECPNFDLLRSVIDDAISCSHGTRKQNWARREKWIRNCGYCVPCLIRRAGMHAAGLDDGKLYGIDVCKGEISVEEETDTASDLRAVVNLISAKKSVDDLQRDIINVAPVDNLIERAEMIKRGVDEIRKLIEDKGDTPVRRSTGI